jgi:hypothetical protein
MRKPPGSDLILFEELDFVRPREVKSEREG